MSLLGGAGEIRTAKQYTLQRMPPSQTMEMEKTLYLVKQGGRNESVGYLSYSIGPLITCFCNDCPLLAHAEITV